MPGSQVTPQRERDEADADGERGQTIEPSNRTSGGRERRAPSATLPSTSSLAGDRSRLTGPAIGEPDPGRAAPSRTGFRDAAAASSSCWPWGSPSGSSSHTSCPAPASVSTSRRSGSGRTNLADHGLYGFYERDFFHDYTPGLPVRPVARRGRRHRPIGRHRRPDQDPADPRRTSRSPTSSGRWSGSSAAASDRRGSAPLIVLVNPVTWFDSVVWGQVDSVGVVFLLLGAARAVARPAGARGDPRGARGAHQAPARDPHPDRRDRGHPARVLAEGRLRRRGAGPSRRRLDAGLGAATPAARSGSSRPASPGS